MSGVVTLEIPARTEYLVVARLALAGIAREVPMSEMVLADLKLAVTEACGNAVRHAQSSERGTVKLRFEMDAGSIEISVEDEGPGILEPGPVDVLETDDLAEGGMGLEIIRAVVDELEIGGGSQGAGTVVRMRKRLD